MRSAPCRSRWSALRTCRRRRSAHRQARVYMQGNIHAGEVEGKESAQILLRELAEGKHADWLKTMVLLIAPIYNADGNERVALNNRGPRTGRWAARVTGRTRRGSISTATT